GDKNSIIMLVLTSNQENGVMHVTQSSAFNQGGVEMVMGDDVHAEHLVMLHGWHLGNRELIGMQTIIMDGVVVEDDVIIGAGSLVPQGKRLASGYLYLGRPAKAVRPLSAEELEFLPYVASNYVALKEQYRTQEGRS